MDAIERLREALRINTARYANDADAEARLTRFQDFLVNAYPAFHRAAERHLLSPYAVLYRWAGRNGSSKPVLFLAHYDVVPAEAEKWTVPPFSGDLKDGYVYGRGALDMKNVLMGLLEAVEELSLKDFKPSRDIWFAFGGDEERNGSLGAMESVKWLSSREINFDWLLDEGGIIAEDQLKGVNIPLALVGIEEKGYLSLELTARQEPGHASRPPKIQAAAVLARALCRIEKHPFPPRLIPTVEKFFSGLAAFFPKSFAWAARLIALFFPFIAALRDALGPEIAAMFRTTVAMTQLKGSAADNVLPSSAKAVINLRLLQPWTVEKAVRRIKRIINDKRVDVEIYGLGTDPVPAGASQALKKGSGWASLETAINEVFPGVPSLPYLMTATTDSRHYRALCGEIFRFSPVKLNKKELSLIHGHDERISTENIANIPRFFNALFKNI